MFHVHAHMKKKSLVSLVLFCGGSLGHIFHRCRADWRSDQRQQRQLWLGKINICPGLFFCSPASYNSSRWVRTLGLCDTYVWNASTSSSVLPVLYPPFTIIDFFYIQGHWSPSSSSKHETHILFEPWAKTHSKLGCAETKPRSMCLNNNDPQTSVC